VRRLSWLGLRFELRNPALSLHSKSSTIADTLVVLVRFRAVELIVKRARLLGRGFDDIWFLLKEDLLLLLSLLLLLLVVVEMKLSGSGARGVGVVMRRRDWYG
jgi:hypothetical protein